MVLTVHLIIISLKPKTKRPGRKNEEGLPNYIIVYSHNSQLQGERFTHQL